MSVVTSHSASSTTKTTADGYVYDSQLFVDTILATAQSINGQYSPQSTHTSPKPSETKPAMIITPHFSHHSISSAQSEIIVQRIQKLNPDRDPHDEFLARKNMILQHVRQGTHGFSTRQLPFASTDNSFQPVSYSRKNPCFESARTFIEREGTATPDARRRPRRRAPQAESAESQASSTSGSSQSPPGSESSRITPESSLASSVSPPRQSTASPARVRSAARRKTTVEAAAGGRKPRSQRKGKKAVPPADVPPLDLPVPLESAILPPLIPSAVPALYTGAPLPVIASAAAYPISGTVDDLFGDD